MSSLNSLPGEIRRAKLTKLLERKGFSINTKGGNGSHIKATWNNEKCVIIPDKIHKRVLYYILKEIKNISGITWDDLNK